MKNMRRFLAVFAVCAVMSGCGKQETETEAPTEAPTEAVTETEAQTEIQTEAPTEAQTEVQTEAEDSMNRTRALKGLVKSSDSSTLTIQTERGKELTLTITGADIQATGGITVGNNVTILYKGSIEDTDTSNAKVQIVKDLEDGETPVTEGELMTEAEESDPDAGAGTQEGTISDVSVDRIVILSNEGDSYYFTMYGADMNLKNGLQEGNYVTVQYQGDLYGPDLVEATSITDAQSEADEAPYGASDGDGYSYSGGTIVDCTTESITITSDEGEELTFATGDASQIYLNGIQSGNYITIEYTGSIDGTDTSGATVTRIYDYSDTVETDTSVEDTDDGSSDVSAEGTDDGSSDASVDGTDDGSGDTSAEGTDDGSSDTSAEGADAGDSAVTVEEADGQAV